MSRLIRGLAALTWRWHDGHGNKSGQRGGKKRRRRGRDFANLPSKLSNYVNQEFSKCQRCWRGRDLERGRERESIVNDEATNQLDHGDRSDIN